MNNNIYLTDAEALYRYDRAGNSITKVGNYSCLSTSSGSHTMGDIALNSAGELFGTTFKLYPPGQGYGAFVRINPATASCSFIVFDYMNGGIYPYDSEFFPAGVVQSGTEVLVGMDNGEYVRIDPGSGDVAGIGQFAGQGQQTNYLPEAAIVSVGGKGYTRVYSGGTGRFVAEFNPSSTSSTRGNMVKLLNFALPSKVRSFVRVGTNILAFGDSTNGVHQIYSIDPVAETITPLPPVTGGPTVIGAATAAPLAP